MSTPWPTHKTNTMKRYTYDTILIDAGMCFTLEARSATEAKISAVPDSLQRPHCSRHCALKLSGFIDHNNVDNNVLIFV